MLNRITISAKIVTGLILMLLPVLIIVIYNSNVTNITATPGRPGNDAGSSQETVKRVEAVSNLQLAIERSKAPVYDMVITDRAQDAKDYNKSYAVVNQQVETIGGMISSPEAKQLLETIKRNMAEADIQAREILRINSQNASSAAVKKGTKTKNRRGVKSLSKKGVSTASKEEITGKLKDYNAAADKASANAGNLYNFVNGNQSGPAGQAAATGGPTSALNLILMAISIMAAIAVFVLLKRNVITPYTQALSKVSEASKTLSASLEEVAYSSRHAENIGTGITESITQLSQEVEEQTGVETEVNELVGRISSAADQVQTGATRQAQDVAETHSIIEQLSTAVGNVVEKANIVAKVASDNLGTAEIGKESIDEAIAGMEAMRTTVLSSANKIQELGQKSKQIGEIIEVIDDIAEQTNLLALNAAIEAARAGEHGKGFAVVADEVRKLAERSARATGEIAELIKGIQDETMQAVESMEKGTSEVEAANQLTQKVGVAITEMMDSTEEVMMQIASVRAASTQMTVSQDKALESINSIAHIADENLVLTEQVTDSSGQVLKSVTDMIRRNEQALSSLQEILSASKEVGTSVEQVSAATQQGAAMSQELDELVKSFVLANA